MKCAGLHNRDPSSKRDCSPGAAHRPELAAHVDQVKAAARELAYGRDILAMDFCQGVRRHVPDPLQIAGMEEISALTLTGVFIRAHKIVHLFLHNMDRLIHLSINVNKR